MRWVSAPHKVLFSGSYTVLEGHPCLVVAVQPRLFLGAEGMSNATFHNPFIRSIHNLLKREAKKREISWETETSLVFQTETSFGTWGWGLGSSASFTTCYLRAFLDLLGWKRSLEQEWKWALEAHFEAQGQKGSGADVTACFWGGLQSFQKTKHGEIERKALLWPASLRLLLIQEPQKADTRNSIQFFEQLSKPVRSHATLLQSLEEVQTAFQTQSQIIEALKNNAQAERIWAKETNIPLTSILLESLQNRFASSDRVFKALGAGGGDSLGCFYDANQEGIAEILDFCKQSNLSFLEATLETQGITNQSKGKKDANNSME